MFKKIMAFVIAVAFLITLLPADVTALSYLTDTDEHWAEDYITTLFNMGIIKGSDGKSLAENDITRGEFTALLIRSIYDTESHTPKKYFSDVGASHMFFTEISIARQQNIVVGKPDGNFGVNHNITREEAVIIVARLFKDFTSNTSHSFGDISDGYIYKSELDKAVSLGIIDGKTNGNFEPYANLKRSESAKIILKILEIYSDKDDEGTVLDIAKSYFYSPSAREAIGKEAEELIFKNEIKAYAKSLGVTVEKEVSDVSFNLKSLTSNTAEYEILYDATFTTTYSDASKKEKQYSGICNMHLLRKNGKWLVYYTNESFALSEKINLTWEIYQNPPSYAPDGLNVVSPTWFEMITGNSYANSSVVYSDSSLTLKLTDKSNQKYVDYAKENGYDLWIVYRNDFDKYNTEKFLKSDDARLKALKLVIKGIFNCKAEGINLDFENMTNKYDYSNHVREVALAAHSLGLIASVDITKYDKTSLSWSMCFDRDYLASVTDYTALMAYDQYGSWSKQSGPVASLSWVEESIKNTLKEVPENKLLLGIPFYVRYWQEKNGKVVKTGAISMQAAQNMADENNAQITYSEKDGQYIANWQKDGYSYRIYLENMHSVDLKTSLIKKYNLAGAASWRRGLETEDVWQAIKNNLN